MNDLQLFVVEVDLIFDELTEFEDDEPQPRKDPTLAFRLNDIKHKDGTNLKKNAEVMGLLNLILEKRQTKEGIAEMRKLIDKKLKEKN